MLSTLYHKIQSLYYRENGYVTETDRGSLVIAEHDNEWVVSFGWNYRDSVICEDENVLKDVVNNLLERGYVFYHEQDMIAYVNVDDSYLKPEEAAKVLGWSNEKFEMEWDMSR